MTGKALRLSCVGLLIAAHALLSVLSMRHESPMTDEGGHYSYGRRILDGNTAFEDTPYGVGKMPFSAFNALPWALAERLGLEEPLIRLATRNRSPVPASSSVPPEQVLPVLSGRLATVFFSCLLALVVFRWSSRLYGFSGGLLSLFLYALCPNLLAHSHLVMVDLYAALGVGVASYFFWHYLGRGGWTRAWLSALMLGLAQLTKYTCLFLYPVFGAVGLIVSWPRWVECARSGDPTLWRRHLVRAALVIGLFLAVALGVIHVGYLGQGSFTPLSEYSFQSESLRSLQAGILRIADVPVPLPTTPVIGLDALRHYERAGIYFPNLYLRGELRVSGRADLEGFKSYYLIAWLYKVPIATQLILIVALASHLGRKGRELFTTRELALLAPLAFYALYFSFLYKAQIGLRHFLVVFPLVFVLCGAAARGWERRRGPVRLAAGALGIYLVASVLSWYPHFLSYFNELVWDRKQAYKIIADSNIDMMGNEWYLQEYLAAHPGTPVNPRYVDRPGTLVVDVNQLVGVLYAGKYSWLRRSFEPVGHIAYSYLIYEIGPEDMHLVPRRPPPDPLEQMALWIEANVPEGAGILREDGTPILDPARYPTEHRPSLGRLSREFLTRNDWDYALVSSATYERFFEADAAAGAEDDGRLEIASRYEEVFAWPLAAEFGPPAGREGARIALHRVPRSDVAYRTHRRWTAAAASWVSDPSIRPATAKDPLTFSRRWQIALFKGRLEPGLYEIRLLTRPARPEAYLNILTIDNQDLGSYRVGRAVVVELPRRETYLLRVFQEPRSSLSEVVIRPAAPGAVPSQPLSTQAR